MVDRELRDNLAASLRRLTSGAQPREGFDDAFYFRFCSTEDRAVREIATYCHSLIASEPAGQSDLGGINSLLMHGLLMRSILFLQTELEYEWPAESLIPSRRAAIGLCLFMVLPAIMALLVMRLPVATIASLWFMLTFVAFSFAATLAALKLIAMKPAPTPMRSRKMLNRGDFDVWPFYRRGDHALARSGRDIF